MLWREEDEGDGRGRFECWETRRPSGGGGRSGLWRVEDEKGRKE